MSESPTTAISPAFARLMVEVALVGAAFAILLSGMSEAFRALRGSGFLSDVHAFLDGARGMSRLFDTGLREPLHCWFLRIGLAFDDDPETSARLTSVVQTGLMAAAAWWFTRRHLGLVPALLALHLLAASYTIHFYAVSGLRDPLYAAMVLSLCAVTFLPLDGKTATRDGFLIGLFASLTYLSRVYGIGVALAVMALAFLQQRAWDRNLRPIALRRALVALPFVAVTFALDRLIRGTTMLADDVRFYRNLEFFGDPDAVPTAQSPSALEYIFGEHAFLDVVTRTASNYGLFVRDYLPSFCHGYESVAAAWFVLAAVLAVATGRWWMVAVMVLLLAPIVFVLNLNQVPGARGVDKRLVMQAMPLAWALMSWSVWWAGEWLYRRFWRRRAVP